MSGKLNSRKKSNLLNSNPFNRLNSNSMRTSSTNLWTVLNKNINMRNFPSKKWPSSPNSKPKTPIFYSKPKSTTPKNQYPKALTLMHRRKKTKNHYQHKSSNNSRRLCSKKAVLTYLKPGIRALSFRPLVILSMVLNKLRVVLVASLLRFSAFSWNIWCTSPNLTLKTISKTKFVAKAV